MADQTNEILNPTTWSTRIQNSALVAVGGLVQLWIGYLIAWGWLPQFVAQHGEWAGIAIASFIAPVIVALVQFLIISRDKFIAYVGSLADDPNSKIKGVVTKTDADALAFPAQPKIVGPSQADAL